MNDFVLWGSHPSHGEQPLKLDGGTLRNCRGAMRRREADGWRDLVILPDETAAPVQPLLFPEFTS